MWGKRNIDFFRSLWNRPLYASMIFFTITFSVFVLIYVFSEGDPIVDDHYFHFKYAYLLRTEGWNVVKNFDWIYLTGLANSDERYTVNLYQISLIPFTFIDDHLFALHMADAFYASIVFAILYYLLRRFGVRNASLYALMVFGSTYFAFRILLGRAFVLIAGLMFLEVFFALEKKYRALFFLSVFHILWHQSTYFMPLVIVGIAETARYLVYQRFFYKNIVAVFLGTIIGLMFYPGFPHSLIGWGKSLFAIQADATMNAQVVSLGGKELYAKDFMHQIISSEMMTALFIFCVVGAIFVYTMIKRQDGNVPYLEKEKKEIMWIFSLFILMIMMMLGSITISGRVFDFLIPAIFLLTGSLISFIVKRKLLISDRFLGLFLRAGVGVFVVIFVVNSLISVYATANSFDHRPTQKAAAWIKEKSDGRQKVFLFNWSSFPPIFFENSYNVYSMGIEPMALKNYDDTLYWKYYNIFRHGYYCQEKMDCGEISTMEAKKIKDKITMDKAEKENSEKIIRSISHDFEAHFIFSDSNDFTRLIELNPQLIEEKFHIKSERISGKLSEITVFKLKK